MLVNKIKKIFLGRKRIKNKGFSRSGFSFVEMNIVVVLVGILGLVVYSSLSSGLKIWQRAKDNAPDVGAYLFFDRLSLDLRNAFLFSGIENKGDQNNFVFASLFNFGDKDNSNCGIGKITYAFDPVKGEVSRSYIDYKKDSCVGNIPKTDVILSNVKSFALRYYYADSLGSLKWDVFLSRVVPRAVEVQIVFLAGGKLNILTKIIALPSGQGKTNV